MDIAGIGAYGATSTGTREGKDERQVKGDTTLGQEAAKSAYQSPTASEQAREVRQVERSGADGEAALDRQAAGSLLEQTAADIGSLNSSQLAEIQEVLGRGLLKSSYV